MVGVEPPLRGPTRSGEHTAHICPHACWGSNAGLWDRVSAKASLWKRSRGATVSRACSKTFATPLERLPTHRLATLPAMQEQQPAVTDAESARP
jgi:hypothetical protein